MLAALAKWRDEIADGYVLGPLRAAIGVLLGWHALAAAAALANEGFFGDAFHVPMLPESLVPSHRMYAFVLAMRLCLAVMVTLAIWAKPALLASAACGIWMLLCDRLQFHHNRYSLYCFALLLAFTPCDRGWRAIEPPVPEPRSGPFWAVRLVQAQLSIIYLGSGGSKFLDDDWRSGAVLGDRIARYAHVALSAGVPRPILEWLARPDAASALAKLAITTELVLCVALWFGPTRIVALWWGVWFHAVIQATTKVETFSVLAVASYAAFATPDYKARILRFDPSRAAGKIAGTAVPLLDWLGRFDVRPWEPDDQPGHSIVVIRRDGQRATGVRAFATLTRCLPLLFPLWAPTAFFASFTRGGDLSTRG